MNGRTHVIYGIGLVFLIYAILVWFAIQNPFYEIPALLAFGVGGTFGALFPDFDFILGNGSPKFHRNTLTHSSLIPISVTIAYAFTPDNFARTLLMFICLGMSTHLLFDIFVSDVPEKFERNIFHRWGYRLSAFFSGKVGGRFKGSGAKWANEHKRSYLLIHTLLCVICAAVLFLFIYFQIDIDGWWI